MRVIIAGSRNINDKDLVYSAIKESKFNIDEIVSGNCRGVDIIGEQYAKDNNIVLTIFKADWQKFGKAAGIIRNNVMIDYANALIAIWDEKSRGTKHIITQAKNNRLKVFIKLIF